MFRDHPADFIWKRRLAAASHDIVLDAPVFQASPCNPFGWIRSLFHRPSDPKRASPHRHSGFRI